jgi:putative colanic acid biosynthesis acetyltransferase WcaF
VSAVPAHPHRAPFASGGERRRAALWSVVQRTLFGLSFHNAYRWRNSLLRRFGATIDPTVRIRPNCRVDRPWHLSMGRKSALGDGVIIYAGAPVAIGERSVISQYTVIAAARGAPGAVPAPASVTIGDDCWIAAESFVPGGIAVPDGVVVGARSVLPGDGGGLEAWSIASGDPARSRRARAYAGRGAA